MLTKVYRCIYVLTGQVENMNLAWKVQTQYDDNGADD